MKKSIKSKKKILQTKINNLRSELMKIEDVEQEALGALKIGKYFKAKNNYSCPEKPEDYWDLYTRPYKVTGRYLDCVTFQKDKDGRVSYEAAYVCQHYHLDSYIEITGEEYYKALNEITKSFIG